MNRVKVEIGGDWKSITRGPLPFGATAIGVAIVDDIGTGALVSTPMGYYLYADKAMHELPKGLVLDAIRDAAVNLLPQVTGARGGRAGRGEAKRRGDSRYYRGLRNARLNPRSR